MTNEEVIKALMIDFDKNQRLFLNGKLHSTIFNKWFESSILQALQDKDDEWRGKIKNVINSACENEEWGDMKSAFEELIK